jgi:zinc transport system permease protein
MLDLPTEWLNVLIELLTRGPWPDDTMLTNFDNVRAIIATLAVCFICGAMGSQVVGNRMAFFSDALAHCAFAGVGFGLVLSLIVGTEGQTDEVIRERLIWIMVGFGIVLGLLIAFVRDQTGLASDTVIGVFFAASVGIGAICTRVASLSGLKAFNIEDFIFGNPTNATSAQTVVLLGLSVLTAVFLCSMYNWMILASASPSLALSRQVPVRLCRYLFIVLLALLVNLGLQIAGTLLINGLLIVPAATAANLARNLRQMFWYSIGIAMFAGFAGYAASWEISSWLLNRGGRVTVGTSGTIVVLSVLLFVLSALVKRFRRA